MRVRSWWDEDIHFSAITASLHFHASQQEATVRLLFLVRRATFAREGQHFQAFVLSQPTQHGRLTVSKTPPSSPQTGFLFHLALRCQVSHCHKMSVRLARPQCLSLDVRVRGEASRYSVCHMTLAPIIDGVVVRHGCMLCSRCNGMVQSGQSYPLQ